MINYTRQHVYNAGNRDSFRSATVPDQQKQHHHDSFSLIRQPRRREFQDEVNSRTDQVVSWPVTLTLLAHGPVSADWPSFRHAPKSSIPPCDSSITAQRDALASAGASGGPGPFVRMLLVTRAQSWGWRATMAPRFSPLCRAPAPNDVVRNSDDLHYAVQVFFSPRPSAFGPRASPPPLSHANFDLLLFHVVYAVRRALGRKLRL